MLNRSRLTSLRKNKGLYQKDMALEFKIERSTYNKYETGDIQPPNDMVVKLASFFNVTTDYLLSLSDSPKASSEKAIRISVLGRIPAGIPIEAIEDVLDYEEVPADWGRGGKEYFALRVVGNSMFPKYVEGDTVIFEAASDCDSGKDCAVIINGEDATFKKLIKQMDGVVLQPINTNDFEPVFYSNKDVKRLPLRVIGFAREIRRKI